VGTTNKTRIADYAQAITDQTAALMKVHTSNYRVVGFTEAASLREIVELARQRNLVVIDDIGSGAVIDLAPYGITGEPIAADSIRTGADLVLFSGDKLLGGPQCGIIVGRKKLIADIARHPLSRALRIDKMKLAALYATLRLYRDPQQAEQRIPLLAFLSTPLENLRNRAERLAPQIAATRGVREATVVESITYLGGGSVPTQQIPTYCVSVAPAQGSVDQLAQRLRTSEPAVMGRIQHDRLLFDLRSVFASQDRLLVEALEKLTAGHES
jgi:L-seryl-tRNA(Ser) seleniumtransferase